MFEKRQKIRKIILVFFLSSFAGCNNQPKCSIKHNVDYLEAVPVVVPINFLTGQNWTWACSEPESREVLERKLPLCNKVSPDSSVLDILADTTNRSIDFIPANVRHRLDGVRYSSLADTSIFADGKQPTVANLIRGIINNFSECGVKHEENKLADDNLSTVAKYWEEEKPDDADVTSDDMSETEDDENANSDGVVSYQQLIYIVIVTDTRILFIEIPTDQE